MNVNIALDLDTILDEVMSPQRLRIWTNTAKQLVTRVNEGFSNLS